MSTILLDLENKLQEQLEKKAQLMNTEPTKLILQAIKDYLFFDKMNQLRDVVGDYIRKQGYDNEDEIFNEIS